MPIKVIHIGNNNLYHSHRRLSATDTRIMLAGLIGLTCAGRRRHGSNEIVSRSSYVVGLTTALWHEFYEKGQCHRMWHDCAHIYGQHLPTTKCLEQQCREIYFRVCG